MVTAKEYNSGNEAVPSINRDTFGPGLHTFFFFVKTSGFKRGLTVQ